MKRCFGYVRVSTVRQGDGVSLDAQKDAILAYAAQNDIKIVRWYEEKVTAAKAGRPMFNAMVQQLRRRSVEGLVVHKIDRSARNFRDWAHIGELADMGIDVHFATETLDFNSRGGRLSADIQAVIAADYIRNLREEINKGLRGRLKQGLYPWPAPIGYLNNGKAQVKTVDPVTAPLVRDLFELYATGAYSVRTIRLEMARRGLRNSVGRPITKASVERMLANPFYTGLIKVERTGELYEGKHVPLIETTLFERVQAVKHGRPGHKKETRHNHLLGGMFRCGICKGAMIPERQKGHIYYRCHTPGCRTKSLRGEVLEEAIDEALRIGQIPLTEEAELDLVRLVQGVYRSRHKTDDLAVAKLDTKLQRLTEAFLDGIIEKPEFAGEKQRLMLQRQEAVETSGPSRPNRADMRHFLSLSHNLGDLYRTATAVEKRQIIDLATSNRLVIEKKPVVEPHLWFRRASSALAVLSCGERRAANRMSRTHTPSPAKRRAAVDALVAAMNDPNAKALQALKAQSTKRPQNANLEHWREAA